MVNDTCQCVIYMLFFFVTVIDLCCLLVSKTGCHELCPGKDPDVIRRALADLSPSSDRQTSSTVLMMMSSLVDQDE